MVNIIPTCLQVDYCIKVDQWLQSTFLLINGLVFFLHAAAANQNPCQEKQQPHILKYEYKIDAEAALSTHAM